MARRSIWVKRVSGSTLIASAGPRYPDAITASAEVGREQKRVFPDADLKTLRNGDWKGWVGIPSFPKPSQIVNYFNMLCVFWRPVGESNPQALDTVCIIDLEDYRDIVRTFWPGLAFRCFFATSMENPPIRTLFRPADQRLPTLGDRISRCLLVLYIGTKQGGAATWGGTTTFLRLARQI